MIHKYKFTVTTFLIHMPYNSTSRIGMQDNIKHYLCSTKRIRKPPCLLSIIKSSRSATFNGIIS